MFCRQTWNDNFSRTCGGVVTTGTAYFFRPWSLFVFRILNNSIIGLNVLPRVPNCIIHLRRFGRKIFKFCLSRVTDKLWYPAHICFRRPDVLTWLRMAPLSDCKTIVFASFASQRVAKCEHGLLFEQIFYFNLACVVAKIFTQLIVPSFVGSLSVALFLTSKARLECSNVNSNLLCFILCRNHFLP